MKLNEIFSDEKNLDYNGFILSQQKEKEFGGANAKIEHEIRVPGEPKSRMLDHDPYEWIDQDGLEMYVKFFEIMHHFPTREDIPSIGPVKNKDLPQLLEMAENWQGGEHEIE